jgi:hypothetical protein
MIKLGATSISSAKLGATQVSKIYLGATEVWSNFDADFSAYLAAGIANGSTMSAGNQTAVNAFIVGCKADGVWTPIKASCLLCAWDSLAGALTPLVGPTPTPTGFISTDYSRTSGLKGRPSSTWLDSNYPHNTDGQNDFHMCAYINEAPTNATPVIGVGINTTGVSNAAFNSSTQAAFRCRSSSSLGVAIAAYPTGLIGVARVSSANYQYRVVGSTATATATSQTPNGDDIFVFRTSGNGNVTNARLSFYSAGTNLTLATLDSRLATLMSALT